MKAAASMPAARLRKLPAYEPEAAFATNPVMDAIALLEREGLIDWGNEGTESEFFVIKLKDKFAAPALIAYANAARATDPEYAYDVDGMSVRAGLNSPWCKRPD
jgi:hypothetical protein